MQLKVIVQDGEVLLAVWAEDQREKDLMKTLAVPASTHAEASMLYNTEGAAEGIQLRYVYQRGDGT